MIKAKHLSIALGLCALTLSITANAEGFIKKEVYSFKDSNGNIVFTDRKPAEKQAFKTQTIEAANATGNANNSFSTQVTNKQNTSSSNHSSQTVRIIVDNGTTTSKKTYKKKANLKRCKSYKKKLAYYSDKMKSGYKNSEYKKLESNRKKYRNLLFDNCETKTFSG